MNDLPLFKLQVHKNIALWTGGSFESGLDLWFLHAFGDSSQCYHAIFANQVSQKARIFLFDLPGHGASPPRPTGLTVEDAAKIWYDLTLHFSSSRRIVLVAHSMSSIIAVSTAQLLSQAPDLVISVEGNLTPADAYFSGQAVHFDRPETFYTSFHSMVAERSKNDEVLQRYLDSLQFADPTTLWTLGRSVLHYPNPGEYFLNLTCPSIHYWDPVSTTGESKAFLSSHPLGQRKLEGLGHWPMVKSPGQFYAAIEQDLPGSML